MSNNNKYWGSKFGYYDPSVPKGQSFARGPTLRARQWSSGANRNNPSKNTPETAQSRRDKERFKLLGKPTLFVRADGTRTMAY